MMSKENIPVLIQQITESALDQKTPEHIRFNHIVALENIRNHCDKVIAQYNQKAKAKR
jgi:hypothetical protein